MTGEFYPPIDYDRLFEPGYIARMAWRIYWRELRLEARAANAQLDHEIMWGTGDRAKEPVGILHAAGLQGAR